MMATAISSLLRIDIVTFSPLHGFGFVSDTSPTSDNVEHPTRSATPGPPDLSVAKHGWTASVFEFSVETAIQGVADGSLTVSLRNSADSPSELESNPLPSDADQQASSCQNLASSMLVLYMQESEHANLRSIIVFSDTCACHCVFKEIVEVFCRIRMHHVVRMSRAASMIELLS